MSYFSAPGIQKEALPKIVRISPDDLFKKVCDINILDSELVKLNNKSKKREYVEARQVTMYIFMRDFNWSQARAGAFFTKDHATALHAGRTVANLIDTNKIFREKYGEIIDTKFNSC